MQTRLFLFSLYKRHSGRKDRYFIAKDTAVESQEKCRQNANKCDVGCICKGGVESQRWGANAKTCPPKRKENRWGQNANEFPESAVKTQRNV